MLDDISQIQNRSVDSNLQPEEEDIESDWSKEVDELSSDDCMTYDILPVNEYENTEFALYENYMESGGYDEPVCAKDKCNEKKKNDDDGYEIPEKTETTLTYDILSNSPVELFLFVDTLDH